MLPRRILCTLLICALFAVASPPLRQAGAAEIEGVEFADRYDASGTLLALNCVGLLRYMVFIKGYVAALYLGDGVPPDAVLSDVPKRLVINYFYPIKAKDFATATLRGIAANVDTATLETLRPKIDRLNALYQDVQPGDRYALTYVPGRGTALALNGKRKGIIEGPDLAAAVFAIWLGPKPLDASLKAQLLKCA